jgi:hypothetical protein
MSKKEPKSKDLASRMFDNAYFSIPWVVLLVFGLGTANQIVALIFRQLRYSFGSLRCYNV